MRTASVRSGAMRWIQWFIWNSDAVRVATVLGAREVVRRQEQERGLLHRLERVGVPVGRRALLLGEHDEALAPIDQLAERRPGARPGRCGCV